MYKDMVLKTLTIRFPEDEFMRLKLFAVKHDLRMTDYIRGLIREDMARVEAEERKQGKQNAE